MHTWFVLTLGKEQIKEPHLHELRHCKVAVGRDMPELVRNLMKPETCTCTAEDVHGDWVHYDL